MRNFKLTVEYEGTGYSGWQRQKGHRSIQEEIEKAVHKITGRRATVHGAGRTDAGVHALGQVASVRMPCRLPAERLLHALNAHLPLDVAVRECVEVSEDFHARYSAKSKKYRYTVYNAGTRPALGRDCMFAVRGRLDDQAMKRAARCLMGEHDFKAFAATGGRTRDTVRRIKSVRISRSEAVLRFDIEGNGFLYKMVRNIVGALLEVGRGKVRPPEIRALLKPGAPKRPGRTVPARGLCLLEVHY